MTRKISDILVTFAAARYQRLERLCGSRVALDYRSKYDKAFPCAVSFEAVRLVPGVPLESHVETLQEISNTS